MTFQEEYDRYTAITKDASTANVALGKQLISEKNQEILGMRDWYFMEKERTASSVASQQKYRLPADCGRPIDFWTVVGGITYHPTEVVSRDEWQSLNAVATYSDITTQFTIIENYIYFYPIPSSINVTLHTLYRREDKEMTAADYSTNTLTATQGSRTIVGSGTVWTASMVGRWVKINGLWYQIDTFTNTTHMDLEKASFDDASAVTYKIGEMSSLPGEFHDLLWKSAVSDYCDFKGLDNPWKAQYEKRLGLFIARYGGGQKTTGQVMRRSGRNVRNPNDYPTGLHT